MAEEALPSLNRHPHTGRSGAQHHPPRGLALAVGVCGTAAVSGQPVKLHHGARNRQQTKSPAGHPPQLLGGGDGAILD